MTSPAVFTAATIKSWPVSSAFPGGEFTPARPVSWGGLSLRIRIRLAWRVFIGRYDALDWQDIPEAASDDQ